jgi:hypothetical protein
MLPLFDMMLRAQNGASIEAIAKQFNLAQEQAAQAMAALMPAFSAGFKRTSSEPYDLTQLMSSMFSGAYAKYFEDMSRAFTPQGMADGNEVLSRLFGSKDVSRAIAQQAEQLTGIGQEILKKIMPVMADALMGGLFKQMSGQMAGGSDAFAASPLGQMQRQWLENLGLQPKAAQPSSNAFDNPFLQQMRSMWGMDKPAEASAANPFAANPFTKAWQDMMTGSFAGGASSGTASQTDIYRDVLNSMFDSGLEVQKSYQKNMESIFDTYFSGGRSTATPGDPKTEK